MAEAAAQDNPEFPILCFIPVTFPGLSRPLFKIFQQGNATIKSKSGNIPDVGTGNTTGKAQRHRSPPGPGGDGP